MVVICFFFFKQKTAYEMRISDWSSDVCSSDLGVLSIAFKYADEQGLLLLDLGDLQAMLAYCAENADSLSAQYGNVTKASVGAIQRQLLQLESQGGDHFFGEPAQIGSAHV